MNDEEFGRLAFMLCKEADISSEAVGNILWDMYDKFADKDNGEWKNYE